MMIALLTLALSLGLVQVQDKTALNEELWNAARAGDVAAVQRALDKGADVNAGNRYQATALFFAADRGHVEVIKLLIARGANVNAVDTFYKFQAIGMAAMNDHTPAVIALIEAGSGGVGSVLAQGAATNNKALVDAAIKGKGLTRADVAGALAAAKRGNNAEIVAVIEKKLAEFPAEKAVAVPAATLQSYAGRYGTEAAIINVAIKGDILTLTPPGQPSMTLSPTSETAFAIVEAPGLVVTFAGRGGMIERMTLTTPQGTQNFPRIAEGAPSTPAPSTAAPSTSAPSTPAPSTSAPSTSAPSTPAPSTPAPSTPARAVSRSAARPWPAFRGDNASGNGDGQGAVTEWDVDTRTNVLWKTPIPGFTTASPVVWGSKIFVVTAISSKGDTTFRTGLYGDVKPVEDLSEHVWKIYALDKASGKILWEETAFKGLPKVKRHTKSTQANSSPATDGTHVVALFGSIGKLMAWDVNGKPLWTTDVGVLDSGWFFDPTYQWGHSSSPIIHDGKVIVQADVQKGSYIAAYDVKTGKELWKTQRDEIPTWGTPTIFQNMVVTNGTTVRGYDVKTGKEVWKLGPNSEVTVGTPVVGDGLVFVTGGYPPVRPIYAVKPTASGDISLPKDKTSSEVIAWSNTAGTYIPTPLYYEGILYTCDNSGIVTAYDAKTGERIYRARVGGGGSFAASPIAADGKLYFSNEDGDVIVVRAGRKYEELAKNEMKEVIMSTPAISDGVIVVRTLGHVYGVGEKK